MALRPTRWRRLRVLSALLALATLSTTGAAAFAGTRYVIRPGDSLSSIAAHLRVSVAALTNANHITNPDRIDAGQALVVPGMSPAATAPTTTPPDPIVPGPLAPVTTPPRGPPRYPRALVARPARSSLATYFRYWSRAYGVPAGLVEAVGWIESGWQSDVVSKTGAVGIGQIEPSTAVFVSRGILHLSATLDARLPDPNIRMSAAYLAWLLWSTNGDTAMALGGYYEGLSTLRDKGAYNSTRRYVASVGALWADLRSG
jgi:soluble lytic murein transglycosylase-like protein